MTGIDRDTPCVNCRYNLRGLDPGGLCPECATPAAHSFVRWMPFTDGVWISRVHRGAGITLLGTLGLLISSIGLTTVMFTPGGRSRQSLTLAWGVAAALSAATAAWGSWTMSAREVESRHRHMGLSVPVAGAALAAALSAYFGETLLHPSLPGWVASALLVSVWGAALYWLVAMSMGIGATMFDVPRPTLSNLAYASVVLHVLAFTACLLLAIGPILSLAGQCLLLYLFRRQLRRFLPRYA